MHSFYSTFCYYVYYVLHYQLLNIILTYSVLLVSSKTELHGEYAGFITVSRFRVPLFMFALMQKYTQTVPLGLS